MLWIHISVKFLCGFTSSFLSQCRPGSKFRVFQKVLIKIRLRKPWFDWWKQNTFKLNRLWILPSHTWSGREFFSRVRKWVCQKQFTVSWSEDPSLNQVKEVTVPVFYLWKKNQRPKTGSRRIRIRNSELRNYRSGSERIIYGSATCYLGPKRIPQFYKLTSKSVPGYPVPIWTPDFESRHSI